VSADQGAAVGTSSIDALYEEASATDALAAERTFLAAERTLLAWLRSGFAMFVTGVTATKLFDDPGIVGTGVVLAVGSAAALATGVVRYRTSRSRTLRVLRRSAGAKR